jgi:DNA-binding HxlR family transcriptional regulator
MRSYNQYCGLAKALDVVGDRWTLLLVRELMIRGVCRYTDLREGLPGIATNLLATRLKELADAGLVIREEAPPPIATSVYRLTERGEALAPTIEALGNWGAPLLAHARKSDAFRTHWLALPAGIHLRDHAPEQGPVAIELRTGNEPLAIEAVGGKVRARPGSARDPILVLSGKHRLVFGVLMGKVDLAKAEAAGMSHEGDPNVLSRIRP